MCFSSNSERPIYIYKIVDHMYIQFRLVPNLLERNYYAILGVPNKPHDITSQNHVFFIVCPGRTANLRAQCLFFRCLSHFLIFLFHSDSPCCFLHCHKQRQSSRHAPVPWDGFELDQTDTVIRRSQGGYHFLDLGLAQPQNVLPGIRFLMRLFVIQLCS